MEKTPNEKLAESSGQDKPNKEPLDGLTGTYTDTVPQLTPTGQPKSPVSPFGGMKKG